MGPSMQRMKFSVSIATCCAIFVATMAGSPSADIRQSSYQLPSKAQVTRYLLQSVDWYRHVYAEQQVANDPVDVLFLHDSQAIEEHIVKLSFEFAKADVTLATTAAPPHSVRDACAGGLFSFCRSSNRP